MLNELSFPSVIARYAYRTSLLLTIIALLLWTFGVVQARFTIGFFGIYESFPIIFILSLAILTLASALLWVSKDKHDKLLFLQVSVLIISLWLIPLLIGGSQPVALHVRDKFIENTFPIMTDGTLGGAWYHNWPGMWLWGATIMNTLGLESTEGIVFITPCILQFLLLFPLYVLLKNTLGHENSNYYWAGIWIFQIANWLEQNYLGPQAMGLLLILILLAILTRPLGFGDRVGSNIRMTGGDSIALVLIVACLTVTHLLSSLIALMIISLVFLVNRRGKFLPVILISAIFIISWMIYQTTTFFESSFPSYLERAMRLDLTLFSDIFGGTTGTRGIAGSESHQAVAVIRIVTTGIFALTSLAGLLIGWRVKDNRLGDYTLLAVAASVLLGLISGLYGLELMQRTWYFFLPVAAYFSIKMLRYRFSYGILIVILVISIFPHFVSHYGNQKGDYVSPAHFNGVVYTENLEEETDYPVMYLGYPYTVDRASVQLVDGEIQYEDPDMEFKNHYFWIGKKPVDEFDFYGGETDFVYRVWESIDSSDRYSLIYRNPEYAMYYHLPVPE